MEAITSILPSIGALAGLSGLLATILVVANRKLHVQEDPRIDTVEDMLPHVNCGACGFPGCRTFAEALVQGKAQPAKCTVSDEEGRSAIAAFLGVAVGASERKVARLACSGGSNVARQLAEYTGMQSCRAAVQMSGGSKACSYGCLGLGDCEVSCDFDAIHMNEHNLPVVDPTACTACGDCVDICPKDLFSLQNESHRLWVSCKSQSEGDGILADCETACTACGRCVADAKNGVLQMKDGLPVIPFDRYDLVKDQADDIIARCPTGAIHLFDDNGAAVKGPAAKRIVRQQALPVRKTELL